MKIYYAKSDTKTGEKRVTNKEHLSKVADLAYEFGLEIKRPVKPKLQDFFMTQENMGNAFKVCFQGSIRE